MVYCCVEGIPVTRAVHQWTSKSRLFVSKIRQSADGRRQTCYTRPEMSPSSK